MRYRPHFRVHICDGCCCGTARKHPDVDHADQRRQIASAAKRGGGEARVVGCLGECHASNLVVVRRRGHKAKWIGSLLDDVSTSALCNWLAKGADDFPEALQPHLIERAQRNEPAMSSLVEILDRKSAKRSDQGVDYAHND